MGVVTSASGCRKLKQHSLSFRLVPLDSATTRHRVVVMMAVGDLPCPPERMQPDAGPPWAREPEFVVRNLNLSLAEALHNVVIVQHDLRLNLFTLLEILKSLALNNVEYARSLVPAAEDNGGAHGKIGHLCKRFDTRVLVEVHARPAGAGDASKPGAHGAEAA